MFLYLWISDMDFNTILILILIGIFAGIIGGFVGVGGGIIIVPALVYFLGLTHHMAIGTSIAVMLPPIGIMAAINFYKSGDLNMPYAMVIAAYARWCEWYMFSSSVSISDVWSPHSLSCISS